MPWKEGPELRYVLFWMEMDEARAADPESEVDLEGTSEVRHWLFRTEAEANEFLSEQIAETVDINRDVLPPVVIQGILQDLAQGRLWGGAVDRYVEAMSFYLGSGEWINLSEAPVMERA